MGLPDPVALVIGGAALAFIPQLPEIRIAPEIVFTVLLPPILYQAALHLPWAEFRESLRPILILAIGLVLATMAAVGFAAHWLIPALPLGAAMVLGAILAATDPTAAIAVMRNLRTRRRWCCSRSPSRRFRPASSRFRRLACSSSSWRRAGFSSASS